MATYHQPVLVDAICDALAPVARAGIVVDCTLGGGGHAEALLERVGAARVIGLDRDPAAITAASRRLAGFGGRFAAIHAPFSTIAAVLEDLGIAAVAAILADIGVSSHQLDEISRGFSFRGDAPLDMRMDPTQGMTAAELLATIDARELARILREYGEEPEAARIAQAIVHGRPTTTAALAELVAAAMSGYQRRQLGARIHPATRTFQALRIVVNQELAELEALLEVAPGLLEVGGRLAVITFHSLEDRATKRRFAALSRAPAPPRGLPIAAADLPQADFQIPSGWRQGRTATPEERERNPRSRSARVRLLERAA